MCLFFHCFCFYTVFSSPLLVIEYPLSLPLFRFVDVFISSCDIFGTFVCSFFFSRFLYWNFLLFFSPLNSYFPPFYRGAFVGDFFLPRITRVHPSSSWLLGWSPVSVLCVFIVAGVVAGIVAFEVGVVFVVVVVVTVVDADDAVGVVDADDAIPVVLLLLVVFWGQELEKSLSCLQCQHCGLLPSTTTIITLSS